MVSPYLTRPLRSLEEVLDRARPNVRGQADSMRAAARRRAVETARAPAWRNSGKPLGPRLVWINDNPRGRAGRRTGPDG